ncbi:MAG TPA: hypothetical protein PKD37_01990 [Oligoflexia bacterium]|nr:hypothetical protein [Oligoflexia bacterium]
MNKNKIIAVMMFVIGLTIQSASIPISAEPLASEMAANCDLFKERFQTIKPEKKLEIKKQLKKILRLRGLRPEDLSLAPSLLTTPEGILIGERRIENAQLDLWQGFQPNRDQSAKTCAISLIGDSPEFFLELLVDVVYLADDYYTAGELRDSAILIIKSICAKLSAGHVSLQEDTLLELLKISRFRNDSAAYSVFLAMREQALSFLQRQLTSGSRRNSLASTNVLTKMASMGKSVLTSEQTKHLSRSNQYVRENILKILAIHRSLPCETLESIILSSINLPNESLVKLLEILNSQVVNCSKEKFKISEKQLIEWYEITASNFATTENQKIAIIFLGYLTKNVKFNTNKLTNSISKLSPIWSLAYALAEAPLNKAILKKLDELKCGDLLGYQEPLRKVSSKHLQKKLAACLIEHSHSTNLLLDSNG